MRRGRGVPAVRGDSPAGQTDDSLDDLARAVRDRRVILFAGAGISMVVGLPSLGTLIRHLEDDLGVEPADGDQLLACQTLAEDYRNARGSIGPLRSWMDRTWSVAPDAIRGWRIHQFIVARRPSRSRGGSALNPMDTRLPPP